MAFSSFSFPLGPVLEWLPAGRVRARVIAAIGFLGTLGLAVHLYRRRRALEAQSKQSTGLGLPFPPGPKPLPIIGNTLDMPTSREWETLTYTTEAIDSYFATLSDQSRHFQGLFFRCVFGGWVLCVWDSSLLVIPNGKHHFIGVRISFQGRKQQRGCLRRQCRLQGTPR